MLYRRVEEELQAAFLAVCPEAGDAGLQVRKCPRPRFGDYQCNGILAWAKRHGGDARVLAGAIASRLPGSGSVCTSVEAAGPGFLNFRIRPGALAQCLQDEGAPEQLVGKVQRSRRVVVDFSSPNVAKSMHVGHIRSTNLGDCIVRILRFLGHDVVTDNHIGDWGTQFGKLIVGWKSFLERDALERDALGEMERLYRKINRESERDPGVLERSRAELVALQGGDAVNRGIWQQMIAHSRRGFDAVYRRLGVRFDHTLGESFYNHRLSGLMEEMLGSGLAAESRGALMVFFPDDPSLRGHPAMIRKSDGAANYMTTDLATLEYRMERWRPDEILYVTDGRQQLHFRQLFGIWRRWRPGCTTRLTHIWFGSITGRDGRPFRSRSGEVVKLAELLDEAEERALRIVEDRNPSLDAARKREVAAMVGIGAVKYADLLPNRQSDYAFDWEAMLSLKGNTAPYLQYAYTRTRGIFRRFDGDVAEVCAGARLRLEAPEELDLARHLVDFPLALRSVIEEYRPNYLCLYLYQLAGLLSRFYENCPILRAGEEAVRDSRLLLIERAGAILRRGLELLGIRTGQMM